MNFINRRNISDLRDVARLAVEATVGITDVVEKMHHTIQSVHPPLGASNAGKTNGLTGFVYQSIRGTTRLIGKGLDTGLAPLITRLPETSSNSTRDNFVSAINGVYGDHLVLTDNPLAIEMNLIHQGRMVNLDKPESDLSPAQHGARTGKLMLFVHGLCLNEGHWARNGQNHAEALASSLGYTTLYLRYNTGLHIADNGRDLAILLDKLSRTWSHPVNEMVIVGHSMGGLVARSACHQGGVARHAWLRNLRSLVFVGTPHHGAPLEKGGNWLGKVLELSPYAAPFNSIARKRSAGISDLRHGSITDVEREHVPLPVGVECYAVAASLAAKPGGMHEHFVGDGLVPLDSALGRCKDPARTLVIPECRQWVARRTGHIDVLASAAVYDRLRHWLE